MQKKGKTCQNWAKQISVRGQFLCVSDEAKGEDYGEEIMPNLGRSPLLNSVVIAGEIFKPKLSLIKKYLKIFVNTLFDRSDRLASIDAFLF